MPPVSFPNSMTIVFPLVFVFLLGACLGSFLNVCIARLPLEKSLLWPSSRCGHCLQAIRWYDNIPLLSYWLLRGRCRVCRQRFSSRYFFVELFTALGLVGLYYVEVIANVHQFRATRLMMRPQLQIGGIYFTWYDIGRVVTFLFHAILFCFLLAAAFCDLAEQAVPLSLTVTG
ncbi:MAG TPA: prepilin peptidase, partial [Gemmataceae bacterium]|nr:prepilin peptidase [Gemmataceae bacterium]